jgi:hypothetical protein
LDPPVVTDGVAHATIPLASARDPQYLYGKIWAAVSRGGKVPRRGAGQHTEI